MTLRHKHQAYYPNPFWWITSKAKCRKCGKVRYTDTFYHTGDYWVAPSKGRFGEFGFDLLWFTLLAVFLVGVMFLGGKS